MYDTITNEEDIKSYLISGTAVKLLRKRLKIGFNAFCFKASMSTRTLAYIERSESIIIKAATMRSLMIAFNLTRNGRRSRPVIQKAFALWAYTKYSPQLFGSTVKPKKITVYLNRETRQWIQAYALRNWVSENQAIVEASRNYLWIASSGMGYCRLSSFDILSQQSI